MMHPYIYRQRERGATALIIVVFSTLLLTVLAVGFIQTMVKEQRASQDSELSQGAYDSALAGAEDGKRALKACLNGNKDACTAVDKQQCDTVSAAGIVPESAGASIVRSATTARSGEDGSDYSQAYTCVVVTRNTKDLVGSLAADSSVIEPLQATDGATFDSLRIAWFKRSNSTSDLVSLDSAGNSSTAFMPKSLWALNRPPVFRVQLMQYKNGDLDVADFDQSGGGNTIYLYPKSAGGLVNFASDARFDGTTKKKVGTTVPYAAKCSNSFQNRVYACEATIQLPKPIRGDEASRVAYVRLTSIYNNADFSLQLQKGANVVNFGGVQPMIDATGRAADVYRRVVERVEPTDAAAAQNLYPRATVDTSDSFCKAMTVTTNASDFSDACVGVK